jgi:adenylylsulfate kinase
MPVVWLTGLSGAGKTTIARAVEAHLVSRGEPVEVLDGDTIRKKVSPGLGFSKQDRDENVRRVGQMAKLLAQQNKIVVVALISPYRAAREEIRNQMEGIPFIEVYVNAPLDVCESRDPKGLYKRARRGEIASFTGFDDPYEPPLSPEVECLTDVESVETCVKRIITGLSSSSYQPAQ